MGVGLLLALYNANTTTDWVAVAKAAQRIPIRAIIPVEHVSPPDPAWAPDYPSPAAYSAGVDMLRNAGVEVYAYTHMRNISRKCCSCCGSLAQFAEWVDIIAASANFDGVMLDNTDSEWSTADPRNEGGLEKMYAPAAQIVRQKGLGVWANGPHILANGSVEAKASAWRPFLELATFTTLFETGITAWTSPEYAEVNYSAALQWPASKLGGYVLGLPENATADQIQTSLQKGVDRGLAWMYPTVACKHGHGPHQGSCTYADLPSYWPALVAAVEKLNPP
jgi:hypothetical protein